MDKKTPLNSPGRVVQIALASPDMIQSWSYGEVTKPETLNYKTLKPEKHGLFDERIFGPVKSYECSCGRYKKIKNKGKKCEQCQVDVVEATVRRYRMGHIQLEEPVAHIWMFKTLPSRLATLLGMNGNDIVDVIYFAGYVVIDPGACKQFKRGMMIYYNNLKHATASHNRLFKVVSGIMRRLPTTANFDRTQAQDIIDDLKAGAKTFAIQEIAAFIRKHTGALIGTGADAIYKLIKRLNLKTEIASLKRQLTTQQNLVTRRSLIKRLKFIKHLAESNNQPEWMILRIIPVIPPDLRPILQLDGGRFTSSEINDLYRRVIIRNNRLRKMKQEQAPEIMINNEKRMLQEAVDALFYNERKPNPVLSKLKTPLKSLTSVLKGKQGRFRQNLLGKRVDYSGRSVIVVGPELKMNQCGLNREMAIVMFKPFVVREIMKQKITNNVRKANEMVEQRDQRVWHILEQVVKERPVMLNRAPTLHRLGIQGFEVVLTDGKAIQLHPLVTTAFNADFDGDQMAVHIPLTEPAVAEVRALMLSVNSILNPKDGKPIVGPTQDMVLGIYYLTMERRAAAGEGTIFSTRAEAILAYETHRVDLHAVVAILTTTLPNKGLPVEKLLVTTIGKLIFNAVFAEPFPYLNQPGQLTRTAATTTDVIDFDTDVAAFIRRRSPLKPFVKLNFMPIITDYFHRYGAKKTALMLDQLKNLGFKFSDRSGVTVSIGDVQVEQGKTAIIAETDRQVRQVQSFYNQGMLTSQEQTEQVYQLWSNAKGKIQDQLSQFMQNHPLNPIFMMADSGARGNISNFTQLMGMRGLMINPKGNIIEIPIKSSFREGLTVFEYFISTHGARKGFADVAIKTADAGYLTRRLVDVAQEVVVSVPTCDASVGLAMRAIQERNFGGNIVTLAQRISGRCLFATVQLPTATIPAGTLLSPQQALAIEQAGVQTVWIRSVLTCTAAVGVCVACYGINLTNGQLARVGDVVGVIAAQSIGEPGTQLTMRNFHTGGVADETDITRGLPRIKELLDVTEPKGHHALVSRVEGQVTAINRSGGQLVINVRTHARTVEHRTSTDASVRCQVGDHVRTGDVLTEGAINIKELLSISSATLTANYILEEAQRVYNFQGIEINDKYFEIIIRQMLKRVEVTDAGDTLLAEGEVISRQAYQQQTYQAIKRGQRPPLVKNVINGIKKAPLLVDSFLAAASFQETTRVLVEAICEGRKDYLTGLKENIILGGVIPAGTGTLSDDQIIDLGLKAQVY